MNKPNISSTTMTLLEQIPMPVVIHESGVIIDCNSAALALASIIAKEDVLGENIFSFLTEDSIQKAIKFMTAEETYTKELFHLVDIDGTVKDVEIKKNYFEENGHTYSFLIINDISERQRSLNNAARIQKMTMAAPNLENEYFEMVWENYPKEIVSGDFFFNHIEKDHLCGFLGDSKGKGLGAALNTSAMKILFNDCTANFSNTSVATCDLNKRIHDQLGEEYVAAILFKIDFLASTIDMTSAGISEFVIFTPDGHYETIVLKGPYLGMIEDDLFESCTKTFPEGAEVFFLTDGYEDYDTTKIWAMMAEKADFLQRVQLLRDLGKKGSNDDMTFVALRHKVG